ncbi:MAG: SurA N-terminal domain-containing protein [Magnetococcales bacterium]|nr:SurA N-terminal domain-containing protein [Magnetococcales bacterium]
MLNAMRRGANTWVIKVLLFFLAMTFAVWGVGSYVRQDPTKPVAVVNGWDIPASEFSRAYDREFEQMREQFGGRLDRKTADMFGLKQRTLNSLISRRLLLGTAKELHVSAPPDYLRNEISTTTYFQEGGAFSKERYETLLRNNRMTPGEYEASIVSDITSRQFYETFQTVTAIPDLMVEDQFQLDEQQRTVAILSLDAKSLEAEIEVTDDLLNTYLEEHQDNFMTEPQAKFRYVMLTPSSVRDSVTTTEEEITAYYEEHRGEFKQEERREARHILLKTGEGNRTEKDALSDIQKILAEINASTITFEDAAKQHSQDASAANGGSLGAFGKGVMVKPFEQVAFSLPVGKVSHPVKTQFGYHLIRVDSILPGKDKPFSQVSGLIKNRVINSKAQDLVYDQSIVMEDEIHASGDLAAIAESLNLQFQERDFASRSDKSLTGIERHPKFLDALFSTEKGDISPVVELPGARFFAVEVLDKKEPEAKTLETAQASVETAYRTEQADKLAKERMDTLLSQLNKGQASWENSFGENNPIKEKQFEPFKESDNKSKAPYSVRQVTFHLKLDQPIYPETVTNGREVVIVKLVDIQEPDAKALVNNSEKIQKDLNDTLGSDQFAALMSDLQTQASIEINPTVLDRF